MGRFSSASARNFGYGKQLNYAVHHALKSSFSGGHFGTVSAHSERFKPFSKFAKKEGITDARMITNNILSDYGMHLKRLVTEGKMSIRYAQNLLSTVNVAMKVIRGDQKIKISPSAVGRRDNIRKLAPLSLNSKKIENFNPDKRARSVLEAARELGLREKEAVFLDYQKALLEAKATGKIQITEGTKGGRGHSSIKRFVPVSYEGLEVLKRNSVLQGDRNNLIRSGESWKEVNQKLHNSSARKAFKEADLKGYHDGRAGYACQRYKELTGYEAPAVAGKRLAGKVTDRDARLTIANELGHNRIDVCISYVGSSK